MDVHLKDFPAHHVAYVANLGGYEKEKIATAWDQLCAWAGPAGLLEPPAQILGISFDDPDVTPADRCRYYACVTIPPDVQPPKGISVLDIPAGRYAVYAFEGTEDTIKQAYRALYGSWLPLSGLQPADHPCYEVYHNTPDEDPEGLVRMEIRMPVEPLGHLEGGRP